MHPTRRAVISATLAALLPLGRREAWATEPTHLARVFIHYSKRAREGRRVAAEVALYLESRGFEIADIRRVGFAIADPRVRYFYTDDKARAEHLRMHVDRYLARATDVNRRAVVQNYTRYEPLPRAGTIEVWIASGIALRPAG